MKYLLGKARKNIGASKSFDFSVKNLEDSPVKIKYDITGDLIGIYRNTEKTFKDSIIFGVKGFPFFNGNDIYAIKYVEIENIDLEKPIEKKHAEDSIELYYKNIMIIAKDKNTIKMPIRNGEGQFRDIYGVYSFLNRAMWYWEGDNSKVDN